MALLRLALIFLGYVLVYAAAANHGRFAAEPWAGLFVDAYTGDGPATPAREPSTPAAPPASGKGSTGLPFDRLGRVQRAAGATA